MKTSYFAILLLVMITALNGMESAMEEAMRGFEQSKDNSFNQRNVELRENDLPERVKKCIKAGKPDEYDREDFFLKKVTPLFDATASDTLIEHTRLLLVHHANPNKKTNDERSPAYARAPLHNAIREDSLRTAILLLNAGAEVKGALPLLMSRVCYNEGRQAQLFQGQKVLFTALLEKGASVDDYGSGDETPLMKIVERMADATGDLDVYHYRVPLHYRMYFVAQLLLKGADTTRTNAFGKTAARYARDYQFIELAELIESKK